MLIQSSTSALWYSQQWHRDQIMSSVAQDGQHSRACKWCHFAGSQQTADIVPTEHVKRFCLLKPVRLNSVLEILFYLTINPAWSIIRCKIRCNIFQYDLHQRRVSDSSRLVYHMSLIEFMKTSGTLLELKGSKSVNTSTTFSARYGYKDCSKESD